MDPIDLREEVLSILREYPGSSPIQIANKMESYPGHKSGYKGWILGGDGITIGLLKEMEDENSIVSYKGITGKRVFFTQG